MYKVKMTTTYVFDEEIKEHQNMFWDLDIYYEKKTLQVQDVIFMFQKCGTNLQKIYLSHMQICVLHHDGWFEEAKDYVEKHTEAGMFGCLLLYPR